MNVSIFTMILWLVISLLTIKGLFSPNKPAKLKKELDETVEATTFVVMTVITLFISVLNVWYLITSAVIINDVYFATCSAILVISTLSTIKKAFGITQKFLDGEEVDMPGKLTVFLLLKILHLGYFGYYIFTGVSLIDLIGG